MQSRIKSNMTNTAYTVVLNQEPTPEGNQLKISKDHELLNAICCSQCARFLILCNWVSTFLEEFIHVQKVAWSIA